MSPSINLKKIFIILFLFFAFPLAQNFDPKTGELIEDQFDPNTGEKLKKIRKHSPLQVLKSLILLKIIYH